MKYALPVFIYTIKWCKGGRQSVKSLLEKFGEAYPEESEKHYFVQLSEIKRNW